MNKVSKIALISVGGLLGISVIAGVAGASKGSTPKPQPTPTPIVTPVATPCPAGMGGIPGYCAPQPTPTAQPCPSGFHNPDPANTYSGCVADPTPVPVPTPRIIYVPTPTQSYVPPPVYNPPVYTNPPAPKPHTVALGGSITASDTGTYTVIQYTDHFASTNQFDSPPPGGFYAAIQVRVCAGSGPVEVNSAAFYLVEPDNTQVRESDYSVAGGKTPGLNLTSLNPGECTVGWINYGVTARPKTVAVDYPDNMRWSM